VRPRTQREIIVVAAAAAVGVLLILYYIAFLPRLTALAQANRQLRAKIAQVADTEQVAARLPAARRERELTEEHVRAVEAQIPEAIEVSKLVSDLSRAIEASGVQFVEIAFPEGQPAQAGAATQAGGPAGPAVAHLQEFPFSMRIRGTFDQTVTFLAWVEAMPRIVVVETLGISGQGDLSAASPGKAAPSLEIGLEMKTFALR